MSDKMRDAFIAYSKDEDEKNRISSIHDFSAGWKYCRELGVSVDSARLTKREMFAVMAMQGFCAKDTGLDSNISSRALRIADDLIKELEKVD